jgi:hypothetical protein
MHIYKTLRGHWICYNDDYIYLNNQRTVSGIFKIKEIPLYNRLCRIIQNCNLTKI